jgi:hypothetical protein
MRRTPSIRCPAEWKRILTSLERQETRAEVGARMSLLLFLASFNHLDALEGVRVHYRRKPRPIKRLP